MLTSFATYLESFLPTQVRPATSLGNERLMAKYEDSEKLTRPLDNYWDTYHLGLHKEFLNADTD